MLPLLPLHTGTRRCRECGVTQLLRSQLSHSPAQRAKAAGLRQSWELVYLGLHKVVAFPLFDQTLGNTVLLLALAVISPREHTH